MPMAFDSAALTGAGSCGCHQTIMGPVASGDFTAIGEIDAVNGVYTLNGSPCAIGDIVDLANSETRFDPLIDIDAGGVKPRDLGGGSFSGRNLPLKDPLLATIFSDGFTSVFEIFADAAVAGSFFIAGWDDPAFNFAPVIQLNTLNPSMTQDAQLQLVSADSSEADTAFPAFGTGLHKISMTAVGSHMAASVDGGAVHTLEHSFFDPAVNNIGFGTSAAPDGRLRSFAFYAPVDDADLPSLSA